MATINHPEVAAIIREAMARKNIRSSELGPLIGIKKNSPTPYNWINGTNAPRLAIRPKLAKALGISPDDLAPRPAVQATPKANGNGHASARPSEQLSFALLADGQARLRLDVTGPIERISPILLHLMQQKLVTPAQLTNDEVTDE